MTEREGITTGVPAGDKSAEHGDGLKAPSSELPRKGVPSLWELRDVNERLLISALREQELAVALEAERSQLAVILAGIGDAVMVVDRTGATLRANAAYERMAGGTTSPITPEDAQGEPLPAEQTPHARAAAGETFTMEFTMMAVDGERRWYEANGQPLPDGGTGYAIVVIRDITLSNQHRRLQDEFLSLASHELRTPLTSVQGYLELLLRVAQQVAADDRIIRYATLAHGQLQRLGVLIRDLTDVSRLQSGKLTLNVDIVDLSSLVERVVGIVRDLPPGHTIHLDLPETPLCVRGDSGRLEQVLTNLLTNAVNYALSETSIDVRLRREGEKVMLEVQDYGRGIPSADLTRIFSRFFQTARNDRPSQGGLGLGLFIAQEVAAAHGGHIDVASIEGEGTTFTVWLPLLETADVHAATAP